MMKKKIFIYAYEGTGLGHLMSLIKIGLGLSVDFKCLIVSGHQAMPHIVPSGMDYCLIPSFQEELKSGKEPTQINRERISLLWLLINDFKPDAFITDFLPLGKRLELFQIITQYPCKKYFTLRSEIGGDKVIHNDVFSIRNNYYLEKYYQKIFLMSDPRITEFETFSFLSKSIQNKIMYVGFVANQVSEDDILNTRNKWLKGVNHKWIVCSAGGGRKGESLLEQCIEISKDEYFKDFHFDINLGYYSSLLFKYHERNMRIDNNLRIINHTEDLYLLHASADIVICTGAYNSLMESIQGQSKAVIGMSVLCDEDDNEQIQNILNLQKFYNIYNIAKPIHLKDMLKNVINSDITSKENPIINMNGVSNIRKAINRDLKSK